MRAGSQKDAACGRCDCFRAPVLQSGTNSDRLFADVLRVTWTCRSRRARYLSVGPQGLAHGRYRPAGMVLNTPIANSADLAGDQAVIARAEAIRAVSRPLPTTSRQRAGCRRRCSTDCTRRSCSVCCCPARPTGSKPIPSLFSMSSRPSPRPTPPPPGASARPAAARCRRPISTCRWRRRSSAIRARCWPGGPAPGSSAVECDGGYRVTGVWAFASGGRHATWLGAHCPIYKADGSPRSDANGGRSSAPCWYAPRTSSGPTSGTPSACAAPPATSSRSTISSCAPIIRSPAIRRGNAASAARSTACRR